MALRYGALPYGALTVRGSAWGPFSVFNGSGFVPAADVERDGDDVVLTLELPGVDVEKDVEVEVGQGRLVIAGRRSHDSESESGSGGALVREIRSGSFRREFALPKGVTAESVEADYQNGLLRVRVHAPARAEVPAGKVAIRRIDAAERSEQEGAAEQN